MKKIASVLIIAFSLFLTSCVVVDNTPGPNGRDGLAFFGIDYDHRPPYSYWDNNRAVPYNPAFGQYYQTAPGIYEFEYFINRYDYYYGTYEVFINYGGPGGPRGEPGYDGADTFLMLITNPQGYYMHEDYGYKSTAADEPVVIEKNDGKFNYKITIQKGNIKYRKAQSPKYIAE